MKRLILLLFAFLCIATTVQAKKYYVSAAGSDANNGTSYFTPWQTIAKVNSFTSFAANDSILFRRGDTFYGNIVINADSLFICCYGTGNIPFISGFTTTSGWTNLGGGIWETSVANAPNNLTLVSMNGIPQEMGRYPNSDAANGGYLTYESFSGSTSITDNQLTASPDWDGAEVCIRKNNWTLDRDIITSHSGTTITYKIGSGASPYNKEVYGGTNGGFGYFIQNDIRTLDKFGEWFLDTTTVPKKLKMYFGGASPTSYTIKVGTLDTLIKLGNHIKTEISYLNFEGSNGVAIYGKGGDHNTVKYCSFSNLGARGVQLLETSYAWVDHCNFNWCLSNAVSIFSAARSNYKQNCKVNDCIIKNVAPYVGLGSYFSMADHTAIFVNANTNLTVENNTIDSIGKCGILWQGNNVTIRKNAINYTTYTLQDYGAIYTFFDNDTTAAFTNRTINNNIIGNCPGSRWGSSDTINPRNAGIYLDGKSMNVNILDNTVFNIARNGIHCNNPAGVNIRGNTLVNNKNAISFYRWADWTGVDIDITIKKNICYSTTSNQVNIYYTNNGLNTPTATTLAAELAASGTIDSNYYGFQNQLPFDTYLVNTLNGSYIKTSPMTLETWQATSSQDAHSVKIRDIKMFTVNSIIGSNKFANAEINSGTTGLTLFAANTTMTQDAGSMISGINSAKLSFSAPEATKYAQVHGSIGTVDGTKQYLFKVTTKGSNTNGILRGYLRKTTSSYDTLVSAQIHSFNTAIKDHEFLLPNPSMNIGASFVMEYEQNSGTTYFDKVEFYEVDATITNINDSVRFDYNATPSANTVYFSGIYGDVYGNSYNGSITLQPYTSAVLLATQALGRSKNPAPATNPALSEPVHSHITIYPNPAGQVLIIDKLSPADEWEQVQLISANGSSMLLYKITGLKKVSLDISNLTKGEYMAVLKRKKGQPVTLKFLKL
ncbi:MAG: right-handed parallel beta-helix repeat-containing protein [Ferruginibacter sp.]